MSVLMALLFYVATAVLVGGLGYKITQYVRTPAPLKIPTTPAPVTRGGVIVRMVREVTLFESLFRSDKVLWAIAAAFHLGLGVVLLRHLRYFTDPVWFWVVWVQPLAIWAALAMLAGLCGLLARRLMLERVRMITGPSDLLMLGLLLAIGVSGLMMKTVAHTDILAVKGYFLGLMGLRIGTLPGDPALILHLSLVAALMIVFPFSKLLHMPGIFFSPTRNQVDNPRERRHQAAWALPFDRQRG